MKENAFTKYEWTSHALEGEVDDTFASDDGLLQHPRVA